ncbi:Major facilitator superfamily domain- general substrate transporter [Apiospora kogelbergensis]|uniref:Major facilitator superfamily domain- general substrate transporter n=1 Tax=Apiospora kogelbergensis TaxID=1337665 RepID=A0AAW0QSW4_9PEZI
MADLELQHRGGDLGNPEVSADIPPTHDIQHAVVEQTPAVPYFKLLVAGFSFFCAGINDGTLGPLIPYIIDTFHIGTGEIAIIYGATFAGWFLAAATNPVLTAHLTLGQLLAVGAALQLLAQSLRPVGGGDAGGLALFCVTFFLQSLGMAYQDSHANTFVSGIANVPHRWISFIHACYALGCFLGPLVATGFATAKRTAAAPVDGWRMVYFVFIGIGVLNMVGVAMAFQDSLWSKQNIPSTTTTNNEPRQKGTTRAAFQEMSVLLRSKSLWLLSLFYFFNLGALLTAGGWVVEFLTTVRGGSLARMGYVPTGYYGGLLLGRLLLAEPTFRLGERRMLLAYSAVCVALQLVFWLQPNVIASAAALSLMGFFFGPFFATGMSVASKLFPKKSQPAALGFIFVLAQAGGAIFPSVTGLVATSVGVAVLQPVVLSLIVASAFCWYLVPGVPSHNE